MNSVSIGDCGNENDPGLSDCGMLIAELAGGVPPPRCVGLTPGGWHIPELRRTLINTNLR